MSKKADSRGGIEVRRLKAADLDRGFIETLSSLSDVEGLTPAEAHKILGSTKSDDVRILVAVSKGGQVVGTTTLLVEHKFIHRGGLVGHIEDVAVRKGHEGKGIGGSLVKAAVALAEERGCYKCILDCKEDLAGFYESLGFKRHDVGMRIDLKRKAARGR
jgi:glucosamine-phosphate N-acetyltransferase